MVAGKGTCHQPGVERNQAGVGDTPIPQALQLNQGGIISMGLNKGNKSSSAHHIQ